MSRDETPSDVLWIRSVLERYEARLVRYASRITGDLDRARDVVQDTFVRLCANLPDRAAIEPRLAEWLFTVCRRRALEIGRKEARMASLDDGAIDAREAPEAPPPVALESRERSSALGRILATLPSRQQDVIRLKFQEGLSYREIARVTNLTETNVGYLIHVGLKAVRERLRTRAGIRPEA